MNEPPSCANTVLLTVTNTVVIVIVFDLSALIAERNELTLEVAEDAEDDEPLLEPCRVALHRREHDLLRAFDSVRHLVASSSYSAGPPRPG